MTRWIFLLFLLADAAGISLAAEPTASPLAVATIGDDAACHTSMQDAAKAALQLAAARNRWEESGGAVFRRSEHCFVHSNPVTSHLTNRVEYVVPRNIRDLTLAAIFHTHPSGRYAREFSLHDRDVQKQLGIPSYLGAIGSRSGKVSIRVLGDEIAAPRNASASLGSPEDVEDRPLPQH